MTHDFETITCEVSDFVATITLNRPEKLNAFTWAMGAELRQALIANDENDDVRVTILTGAGRGFCAGADLSGGGKTFADGPPEDGERAPSTPKPGADDWPQDVIGVMYKLRKPVIVAYNGAAVGVGLTMTLPLDIRIAAESARFGMVFVRRGIVPEATSPWLLPRLIGVSKAAELMYTGRIIGAQEALECGLVSRVVPDNELLPAARELAHDIATYAAPVSVAITKRMLMEFLIAPPSTIPEIEAINGQFFFWTGRSADAREGVMSFLEKRDPKWTLKVSTDMPDFSTKKK